MTVWTDEYTDRVMGVKKVGVVYGERYRTDG